MRNANAILELAAADIGAFGGDGQNSEPLWSERVQDHHGPATQKKLKFGFTAATEADSRAVDLHGVFGLSNADQTVVSECDAPRTALAVQHDVGADGTETANWAPLADGCKFSVTVDKKSGSGSEGFAVGLVGKDWRLTKEHSLDRMWGMEASGRMFHPSTDAATATPSREGFGTGDVITVELNLGRVCYFKNDKLVAEQQVVETELYAVVILPTVGDKASIELLTSYISIPRRSAMWNSENRWNLENPIWPVFDHATLRRFYPQADPAEDPSSGAEGDVRRWLIESHLWGPGHTPQYFESEAIKVSVSLRRRLLQELNAIDPIRKVSEARCKKIRYLVASMLEVSAQQLVFLCLSLRFHSADLLFFCISFDLTNADAFAGRAHLGRPAAG